MTNNMDEFDHDQFDSMDQPEQANRGAKQSLADAWKNKPIFKLLVIMGVVGIAMAGALGVFSGKPEIEAAGIVRAPELKEAPGGSASPFFIEQNKQANEQRVDQALQQGGSALPTPVGQNIDLADLTDKNKKDPLLEFKAETDRLRQELRAEQQQNAQQMQVLQQQMQTQQLRPEDDSLAKAMQKQMQQLMDGWAPRNMKLVNGAVPPEAKTSSEKVTVPADLQFANVAQQRAGEASKTVVPAGTVNYAQLLTEANSDVPGAILAQILSGPLAGGRAIGRFQVMNDYLVLTFSLVSYKGKEYPVNILALNPDTTLGGMATEVDHRYFTRILLPAAASFMSAFGSALSSGGSTTTVTDNGILVEQAKKGYKDAAFAGLGQAGTTVGQFFQQQAQQTKTLVRVAVGTPLGMFFLSPVKESSGQQAMMQDSLGGLQGALLQGYQQQGGIPGYAPQGGYAQTGGNLPVVPGYGMTGSSSYPAATYPQATGYGQDSSGYRPTSPVTIISPTGGIPLSGTTTYYGRY